MEKYNSSDRMKLRFEKVLQRDFSNDSIATIKRAVELALGPLPYTNWPMDKSWAVIRARSLDPSQEDISNPKTFGSPPNIETSLGRANLIAHPVLYGTFDARTAMQEIKVPLGSECYVSIWEFVKKPPTVTTFLNNADEKNDLFELNHKLPKNLPLGVKGGYTIKSMAVALELRAGAFTSENYSFTSRIAHDIIYNKSALTDGLVYPSVADPYRCNIALNPDFVEKNMMLKRVYKQVWSGAFIFRVLARGSNVDGKIIWEDTGSYELDEQDYKYIGSRGPEEIHPSSLEVLSEN